MAKRKRTKKDIQHTMNKTKDRATRTPLKTGSELRCSGRVSSSCSTWDTRRATVKRHEHNLIRNRAWTKQMRVKTNRISFTFYPEIVAVTTTRVNNIHSLIMPWVSLLLVPTSLVITYNLAFIREEKCSIKILA
jgi:hypothetical protein